MTTELDFKGLQELLWAFAGQRTVTTASRCGILGRLAERAWEPAGLAVDLGLDPEACDRVVRALVALGVARREGTTFRLVPDLEPLFQPGPDDLAPFLEHSHRMYENWGENLETWLRTGRWPRRERSPEETLAFARAMRGIGVRTAREIVDRLDLEGVRRVLDIGGSLGHWAETLCRRSPDIRVTVFDILEVAHEGTKRIRGTAFEDRIEFVGGDYLEDDLGSGFDLVLLANVVHQELRPRAERLIERAAAALACERMTDGELDQLNEAANASESAAEDWDFIKVSQLDFEFHRILADATGTFSMAFWLCAILTAGAVVLTYFLREPV